MRRWKDWLRQAKRKLDSAKWDLKDGFFERVSFLEALGEMKRYDSTFCQYKIE